MASERTGGRMKSKVLHLYGASHKQSKTQLIAMCLRVVSVNDTTMIEELATCKNCLRAERGKRG